MKSQQQTQKVSVITEKACVFRAEPGDGDRRRREGQGLPGAGKGGEWRSRDTWQGVPAIYQNAHNVPPYIVSGCGALSHTRCRSSPQPFRTGHAITLFVLWLKKWQVRY